MARSSRVKASGSIEVHGLNELHRALREMDDKLPKELRDASKEVATTASAHARRNAYSLGAQSAKVLAPSIKPSAGRTSAGVSFGGPAYPAAGGAEFGSVRYKQFPAYRGNGSDAGYAVYPAIRDELDDMQRTYEERIDDLTRRVGLR